MCSPQAPCLKSLLYELSLQLLVSNVINIHVILCGRSTYACYGTQFCTVMFSFHVVLAFCVWWQGHVVKNIPGFSSVL